MKNYYTISLYFLTSVLFTSCFIVVTKNDSKMHPAFVELNTLTRDNQAEYELELRYFSEQNFVGRQIPGYESNKAILTRKAANALLLAQRDFIQLGYKIKIFDAYRPQTAVDFFVNWASDLQDLKNKSEYYPNVEKSNLFSEGYIAARSGHSRGSAVDLTLVDLESGQEIDMGSPWDFFDPISWPTSEKVTKQQRAHRRLLAATMQKHGFASIKEEWWHFYLVDEPFPNTYFQFPVK